MTRKFNKKESAKLPKSHRYYGYNISKNFMCVIDREKNEYFYIKKKKSPQKYFKKRYDPLAINTLILIYEDRVNTWFLDIAKDLKKNNEAGFVILLIAAAYIEGTQQVRDGKLSKGNSKDVFIKGMRRIFKGKRFTKEGLTLFYDGVRCGLFHDGMTRGGVTISGDYAYPLKIKVNEMLGKKYADIEINSHLFLEEIRKDFGNYVKFLKNPNQKLLRGRFKRMYYSMHSGKPLNEDPSV